MTKQNQKITSAYLKSVTELLIASIFWGSSFTLARWALTDLSTSALMFWRFILAFFLAEVLFFIFNKKAFFKSNKDILLARNAGIFMGLSLVLQTHGLQFTSATNSSFITSLYVVIIPFISLFFYKQKIEKHHFIFAITAFLGMGFLLNIHQTGSFNLNQGDLLTLGCAVTSTFHIIYVGQSSSKIVSSFRFNTYQIFWAFIAIIPFFIYEIFFKKVHFVPAIFHYKTWLSVLGLSIFVSLLAFYLQVRAQKILNNTTTSLLCLLEAPNAFLFANIFLNENINLIQGIGILLILISSIFSVYMDRPQNRKH